jgi:hypothetical protein
VWVDTSTGQCDCLEGRGVHSKNGNSNEVALFTLLVDKYACIHLAWYLSKDHGSIV